MPAGLPASKLRRAVAAGQVAREGDLLLAQLARCCDQRTIRRDLVVLCRVIRDEVLHDLIPELARTHRLQLSQSCRPRSWYVTALTQSLEAPNSRRPAMRVCWFNCDFIPGLPRAVPTRAYRLPRGAYAQPSRCLPAPRCRRWTGIVRPRAGCDAVPAPCVQPAGGTLLHLRCHAVSGEEFSPGDERAPHSLIARHCDASRVPADQRQPQPIICHAQAKGAATRPDPMF